MAAFGLPFVLIVRKPASIREFWHNHEHLMFKHTAPTSILELI
jgi:hypothetical protein